MLHTKQLRREPIRRAAGHCLSNRDRCQLEVDA
jgi:hypothetical protein